MWCFERVFWEYIILFIIFGWVGDREVSVLYCVDEYKIYYISILLDFFKKEREN